MQDFTTASDSSIRPDYARLSYQEAAAQTAELRRSNNWAAMQTGVLAAQTAVMASIHGQLEQTKNQNAEALAIQQELLRRDQLQSDIEEFIFQTEKLVAECSDTETDIPASTRYFLCESILQKIQMDGLSTAIIKGRGNKLAFEEVVKSVGDLRDKLRIMPEVQDAILWAQQLEKKRQSAIQAKKSRQETIRQSMVPHQRQLESLQASLNSATFKEGSDRMVSQIRSFAKTNLPLVIVVGVLLNVFLVPLFVIALPMFLLASWNQKCELDRERNVAIDRQIAEVSITLADLQKMLDAA